MVSEQEMERLMEQYGDAILRMCYIYLKDYQLAEDAAQETFIKAMRFYDSFAQQSSEKTWLSKIAINSCKNIMRTRWFKSRPAPLEELRGHAQPDEIHQLLERDSVSGAIARLSTTDKEVILLYYYQELSVKQIAEILGKNENTVTQRLHRARNRLKCVLAEVDYSE